MRTPRQKLQEKKVLDGRRSPILKKYEATRYRSACVKLSYLAKDRLDLAGTAKHVPQRMTELREFEFAPLTRAAKPKAALRFRRQKHVAGDSVSRKSSTESVAQIGNHTAKSGSTLQSLTALSVGEAEFYAVVKGGQVGRPLRSINWDLGISMKVEIQSDSSTSNSLTDRLGAGHRTKHIETRYFWIQERIQDGDLSIKKVFTAKNCADVGTKSVSASVLQQRCKFAGLVVLTMDPQITLQDDVHEPMMDLVTGLQTRRHEHKPMEESAGNS